MARWAKRGERGGGTGATAVAAAATTPMASNSFEPNNKVGSRISTSEECAASAEQRVSQQEGGAAADPTGAGTTETGAAGEEIVEGGLRGGGAAAAVAVPKRKEKEVEKEAQACAICLESFEGRMTEPPRKCRQCGVQIHQHCLARWFESQLELQLKEKPWLEYNELDAQSCPMCRSKKGHDKQKRWGKKKAG